MAPTDTAIRKAKPRNREYKLTDGEGLFLLVRPNGSKLWQMAYRYLGKAKKLSIGAYPAVSLGRTRGERACEEAPPLVGILPMRKEPSERRLSSPLRTVRGDSEVVPGRPRETGSKRGCCCKSSTSCAGTVF